MTCQSGFEQLLAREATELHGAHVAEQGPGWARVTGNANQAPWPDAAFAHLTFCAPAGAAAPEAAELHEVRGSSVNALATAIANHFFETLRGERIEHAWPSIWSGPHELVGLGRRVSAVESAFTELLKKKLSRVAKLATAELPRQIGLHRGLFVWFVDFDRAVVARHAYVHGPRRMADDSLAPSRSYLKVEEAYWVLGREPAASETVCDLGAAPGGWSYSAAKRGARVIAVDNGPLKAGAFENPLIDHRREDAFRFGPSPGQRFDWLFCDMVEEPHHVLRDIFVPWLERRWCCHFVVNLKFGRVDPIALWRELTGPSSELIRRAPNLAVRHLYHDREEFTLVGTVAE